MPHTVKPPRMNLSTSNLTWWICSPLAVLSQAVLSRTYHPPKRNPWCVTNNDTCPNSFPLAYMEHLPD